MKEILEVREFDKITCNKQYAEQNKSFKFLEKKRFDELEEFITTVNDQDDAEAAEFFKISTKPGIGRVIQPKNYVGLIQLHNGFQVQILPKIDFAAVSNDDNVTRDTKKVFLNMLKSLHDFPSKVFNDASLKTDHMNLYEIFIRMYINEVKHLLQRGLKSSYLSVEDNCNFFKGKLLVSTHIQKNLIHKERFYVQYDEFSVNRAENRLIKSTLMKIQRLSNSALNVKEINQLLAHFEMIEPSLNHEKDFSQVSITRNTKDYESLMQWSKVFLMNQSFTTFTGDHTAKSLLFPMEKVFESYVFKHLNAAFSDVTDCHVSKQHKAHYLFDTPRKKFALKPDIVITLSDRVIILDTKWKALSNRENKNYGISQADMYQMYVYAKKYDSSEVYLLYPLNENVRDISNEKIYYKSHDGVSVTVFFVDVADINESMFRLKRELLEEV